ncbi:hypothetical protein ACJIZ3_003312 [Penstemon smallii]|uniref:NAC domain-containing protein n=1 Tax=Penstemon smallii TaxID=265156 RepID=A0ABD3U8W0_9LAMI
MLAVEEILCELERNDTDEQTGGLPPGFRFHPTDEELITFYLASKVFDSTKPFSFVQITEVDLNRCEPWELPDVAKMGEREWYFFSLRDRKYPTGLRTNRATGSGYWKATGKDREVYSSTSGNAGGTTLIGMKKTLVFYRGRAPRGEKTKWVMHEYRLEGDFSCRRACKEEWVICRIIHKMGDKKSQPPQMLIQNQNYMTKSSLPPLLEPPQQQTNNHPHDIIMQTLNQNYNQNPFLFHNQESDHLKSLHDIFSVNFSQPNSTLKELSNVISKQCKKEETNSLINPHSQLLCDGTFVNMNWAEKILENNATNKYPNPWVCGLDSEMGINNNINNGNIGVMDVAAIDHVMSTETTFRWW